MDKRMYTGNFDTEKAAPEYLKYIDCEILNDLMAKIAKATGMGIAACDYTGRPMAGAIGYCDFCKCVQSNPESKRECEASTAIGEIQSETTHQPYVYVCPHGLMEVSIPINVKGKFMGGIVAGQIYCDDIPEDVNRVASLFPNEILCAQRYAAEMKNCTRMKFEDFKATATMIYAMLNEIFRSRAKLIPEDEELKKISEENEKLRDTIEILKTDYFRNMMTTSFLTGSLASVANEAAVEGAVKTNEMAGMLFEFIYEMSEHTDGNKFIWDEMRLIEQYLKLQQLRVDNLEFEIIVPEDIKLYRIPALLLYPIVEYSLYYGLLYKEDYKKMKIQVAEDREFLNVLIEDNGLGMKPEEVRALYPQITEEYKSGENDKSKRQLLEERLELLFIDEWKLTVKQRRGKGMKILLRYPVAFAKGDK